MRLLKKLLPDRVERIIGKLDERITYQSHRKGADKVSATALVGAYHDHAGYFERRFQPHLHELGIVTVARALRELRRIVRKHAEEVHR